MDYADIKSPLLQDIYIFFLTGFSYWLIGKAGPIRKKLVCKMMGRTEESFDRIVYKDATWQSWVNQDKCIIGRHRNFDLFKRTDMYSWHGIASSTEKKLAKQWQDKGYTPLCELAESGVTYRNEDVNDPERIDAKDKVYGIARTTAEYMRQMEAAPFLKASGLEGSYRVLAD